MIEGTFDELASDVYSFACLVLGVLTGKEPFYWIRGMGLILAKVRGDGIDRRQYPDLAPDDAIWTLLESWWQRDPRKRPTMPAVLEQVSFCRTTGSFLRLRLLR